MLFFRELAEALTKREDVELAVVGGPLERDLSTIFGGAASGWSYLEKLPLRETFALVAAADLVIANSSMLMHVAAAFCKPVVVLLGESIGSREGHDAQWGYAEGYWSLGKERGGAATIASPGKALTAVEERLASLPRRG